MALLCHAIVFPFEAQNLASAHYPNKIEYANHYTHAELYNASLYYIAIQILLRYNKYN